MQYNEKIRPFDIIVGLTDITYLGKLLLFKIYNLDNGPDGCFASDEWLADLFGVHKKSINRLIGKLESKGYIIKDHPNFERRIKVTLPQPTGYHPSNPTVTNCQPNGYYPSNPMVDYNTKEITKETTKENRESALAFNYLLLNWPNRIEPWLEKYKPLIKEFEKFILDYNDLVAIKQLKFEPDILFNFLCKYAKGYIKNTKKFSE